MNISRREFLQASIASLAAVGLGTSLGRLVNTIVADGQRPNILIFLTDDQDLASMPVMRNLTKRPYGNWITYTNAFANEARCCPSRAALITGQYSHHHGVSGNGRWKFLDEKNTLPKWLQDSGYATGFIGKYLIGYPKGGRPAGWTYWQRDGGNVDKQVSRAAGFLDGYAKGQQPFFLLLSFYAPHYKAQPGRYAGITPYIPEDPPNYLEADVSDKPEIIRKQKMDPKKQAKWRKERENSQRELMMIDDGIQHLLDKLHNSNMLDNTVVIFLADNGFSWGSHNYLYKHLPYEECSKVPMMIRWPGLGGNRTEERLVSNVDLAPTIVELARVPAGRSFDGRSLTGIRNNPNQQWPEAVLLQRGKGSVLEQFIGIRVPGWMYAEYANGDRELYDLDADPYQMNNVVNLPEYGPTRDALRKQMMGLYNADPSATPTPTDTLTPTPTDTPTPTPTDTATATPTPTDTPTPTPTDTATPTPTPTDTPTP